MLMKYSLPQPDADMSLVSPIVVAMFTPLPLWLMVIAREIHRSVQYHPPFLLDTGDLGMTGVPIAKFDNSS